MEDAKQAHWDQVYASRAVTEVSWYEASPARSLELIRSTGIKVREPIIDVGGGASVLAEELLNAGYEDVTVLDISAQALDRQRERLSRRSTTPVFIRADVTRFHPQRTYALWHDRAVFHFLVQPEDRRHYVEALSRSLRRGGNALIATFGPSGPERCSGLPVMRYDAAALAAELGSDFDLVSSSIGVHRTPSGAEQQFLYCRFERRP